MGEQEGKEEGVVGVVYTHEYDFFFHFLHEWRFMRIKKKGNAS
jgi:hypothetical protein